MTLKAFSVEWLLRNKMIKKTYFVHYTKLKDRYDSIIQQCEFYKDIEFIKNHEFITKYDQEYIDNFVYNTLFDESPNTKENKCVFVSRNSPEMNRNMQGAELSNAIKHYECYKNIANSAYHDDDIFLIFEDDIIFKKTPLILNDTINNVFQNDWNIIFCGEGSLLKGNNDTFIFNKELPSTNGLCSYVINKKTANIIYNFINENKISFPMDHELNYIMYKTNMQTFWSTPITMHGSICGYFNGTVIR